MVFVSSPSSATITSIPTTISLSRPSACRTCAVNAGGRPAGMAPSAASRASANIFGPLAATIRGYRTSTAGSGVDSPMRDR
ncbi:Uncharacterised protein [Mycobacteroides abscessus subsp. abscessus]|nr:Uncharacterised protein [Mycobacteroides abscessus subsp. abscessus]SKW61249.1 Uncharacterised protein [Mycobacteroides abscessus subsp. abscessus]